MEQTPCARYIHAYSEAKRQPDARLFAVGELVRFPQREGQFAAGTVLQVVLVDGAKSLVHLRRRNGETIPWKPSGRAQVFSRSDSDVRRGSILKWTSDQPEYGIQRHDLARVVEVKPGRGVTIRSRKLGEVSFELDPGVWHNAITLEGVVAHLRGSGRHRLEPYRDHDPVPEEPTHRELFNQLARPFSLTTHGCPPNLGALSRGDLVYFASTSSAIPDNHAFVISEIDPRRRRVRLVHGREVSAQPEKSGDFWWEPRKDDEVRLYKPAHSVAAQDLVVWRRDDPKLLVRRGDYAEVLQVQPVGVAVTGVTSTPELLRFDTERWSPRFHRENDAWHLSRVEGRSRQRDQSHEIRGMMLVPT